MNELYSICWNITNKCNENCKFCYRKLCKDNTIEENKKIFDQLSKIKIGKISFCGGEPLLYDGLFEIVDYIHNLNPQIKLSITTNGQIIDDKLLEKIISKFDYITYSIDSSNEEMNEYIGRGYNHLSKIENLLKKCNNRIKIKINTVVTKINIEDLENIYKIISKYNISRWKILRFYPLRRGKENQKLFYLNDESSEQVKKIVAKLNDNSRFKIHYNDFDEFTTSYFNIYPDGSIENSKDEDIGNLKEMSILDIINLKKEDLINHNMRKNYEEL